MILYEIGTRDIFNVNMVANKYREGIKVSMEEVRVDLDEFLEKVRNIQLLNIQIVTKLNEIKEEINSLDFSSQNHSSIEVKKNFNKLESRFENYKNMIGSYGILLDDMGKFY